MSDWEVVTNSSDWEIHDPNQEEIEDESFGTKLPRNLLAGLAEMGHGILNTPYNIAKLINPSFAEKIPHQEDYNYAQILGQKGEGTLSDKLIQGLAQYAPALGLPGANIGRIGKVTSSVPKIGGLLSEVIEQAIPQAAFGLTQSKNPLEGAGVGALGAGIGTVAAKGLSKSLNALRPKNLLRGQLTPEELAHNLEIAKGTETGLGRLLDSPALMRLQENVLPSTLGSGAEKTMERNASNITQKGEDLFAKMNGNMEPVNYGVEIQDALKAAEREARIAKDNLYNKLDDLASKSGVSIGRNNFQKAANKIIEDIEQSPELRAEFGKDLYSDIIRYAKNDKGNNLKLTNIFRSKLGQKANELLVNGQKYESGLVKELKDALDKDIDNSFNESGNAQVKEAYHKAQKEYKENYAPFEDKDIIKFTRKGGDPDLMINHFVRLGTNDRSVLLRKLSDSLRSQDKSNIQSKTNLLASAYFSKAMDESGKINPVKFGSLYQRLGKNQRKALLNDPELHKEVKNYADLVNKNKEAFNLMHNPKTGARNTELLMKMGQVATGAAVGLPAIAGFIGSGLAGKAANKALTSEKIREKLIKAMLSSKQDEKMKIAELLSQGLTKGAKLSAPLELYLEGGRKK